MVVCAMLKCEVHLADRYPEAGLLVGPGRLDFDVDLWLEMALQNKIVWQTCLAQLVGPDYLRNAGTGVSLIHMHQSP